MNKKAISPLVATLLLLLFALILGAITMSWGKDYVEGIEPEEKSPYVLGNSYIISIDSVSKDPLKEVQVDYILGKITKEEYMQKEKEILNSENK